jgi:hypothetical protein
LRALLRRFLKWLHLVATDEESARFDQIDRDLRSKGK